MRGAMIGVGAVLIQRFDWILYLFGAFLLYAGFKLSARTTMVHPEKNPVLHWVQKILPMSQTGSGARLFVREAADGWRHLSFSSSLSSKRRIWFSP